MPAALRVLAGPSPYSLTDISDKVNTNKTHRIVSDTFEGVISLQIKRFPTHHRTTSSDYFERLDRQGITWSIQVQGLPILPLFSPPTEVNPVIIINVIYMCSGRFLQPHTADDVLFGNVFGRPLTLPWGSSAAFQLMK